MSTDLSAAGSPRPLHPIPDPSELLATAHLALQRAPRDALLVIGRGTSQAAPMVTSASLDAVLDEHAGAHLSRHLGLMHGHGVDRVLVLLVLGDGRRDAPPRGEAAAIAGHLTALLADVADSGATALPETEAAWVLADGTAVLLFTGPAPTGEGSLLEPAVPLRDLAETRTAARAVLDGKVLPDAEPTAAERAELAALGAALVIPERDLASTADPGELLERAAAALDRLRSGRHAAGSGRVMTDCERVAALLSALAVDRLHWELLAQLVERGQDRRIDRERLLQELVSDPVWRPDPSVCAGGSVFRALEGLREVAAGAWDAAPRGARGVPRDAWRGLTALLVLLSWWNHRYASAGELVDELVRREPDSTLAPLLGRMTDTPIHPAWWPSP